MSQIKSCTFAMLALAMLSACALSEDVAPIHYGGTDNAKPIVSETKPIKLEVTDNRGVYRGQIGAKVNGFGQEMAAI